MGSHIEVVEIARYLKLVHYVVPLVLNACCSLYGVFMVQISVILRASSQFIVYMYVSCSSLTNDYFIYLVVAFMYE